jgi:hypothetical protein
MEYYEIEFPGREDFIRALRFKNVFAESVPSKKLVRFTTPHARNSFVSKLRDNDIPYNIGAPQC